MLTNLPSDRIYGYPLDCAAADGALFSKRPPEIAVGRFSELIGVAHIPRAQFIKHTKHTSPPVKTKENPIIW
jgi:hypothetical protein